MQLLRLLADGRFHSGEELGALLGISRSAIWKQLQQLQAEQGVRLHKVPGKGYRLEQPMSLLAVEVLSKCLPETRIRLYEQIDSTNAAALRLLSEIAPPFIVLAESQTAGRGRRGRQWVSPYGENLYLSLVIRIERPDTQLQALSLVVGLAVLRTLRDMGVAGVGLKWPNDLLIGGQKIAGILLELNGDPADICHVVIGVGVNVNMLSASGIDQDWTSMRRELGQLVDRNDLTVSLVEQLNLCLRRHRESGFAAFHREWEDNHAWHGRSARLTSGVHEVSGVVLGVTIDGALRLAVDAEEQVYSGGELSLRLQHDT